MPKIKIAGGVGGASSSAASGASRDWLQLYSIYGIDEWPTVSFLLVHSLLFASFSIIILTYFNFILDFIHCNVFPSVPIHLLRLAVGFSGSLAALSSACLHLASLHILHSSLILRWSIAQRMVSAVPDWSSVRAALNTGCSRGILLNAAALHMKKKQQQQGACRAHIVGLERKRGSAVEALRRAKAEGVERYVTCREGDSREMPFGDETFDVVVSGLSDINGRKKESEEERGKGLVEMVRVLRPGGVGVVWDLAGVDRWLKGMGMVDVRVSEGIMAYMTTTRIVAFRKPAAVDVPRVNIC